MQDLTTKTANITQHCRSKIQFLTLMDDSYFQLMFSRPIFP